MSGLRLRNDCLERGRSGSVQDSERRPAKVYVYYQVEPSAYPCGALDCHYRCITGYSAKMTNPQLIGCVPLLAAVGVGELNDDVLLRHIDTNDCIAAHLLNQLARVLLPGARFGTPCHPTIAGHPAHFLIVALWRAVEGEDLHSYIGC